MNDDLQRQRAALEASMRSSRERQEEPDVIVPMNNRLLTPTAAEAMTQAMRRSSNASQRPTQ